MKLLTTLPFLPLLLVTNALAQRVSLGPVVSLGAGHYLAAPESPLADAWRTDGFDLAWRVGLSVEIALGERDAFLTGVRYGSLGTRPTTTDELRWGSQWNGTEFDPDLPSGEPQRVLPFSERIYVTEVPIEWQRALSATDDHFYVRGGLTPTFVRFEERVNSISTPPGPLKDLESRQSFWLGATAALGYEWTCSDKVAFYAQAGGTVQLLEEARGSRSRRWDVGLAGGVRFALR